MSRRFRIMRLACVAVVVALWLGGPASRAQESLEVGIEKKTGALIPLDLEFTDADGDSVVLRELFDKPVVLVLVYYRCPSICTPLMRELSRAAAATDLAAGRDYTIVVVSFDPEETPEIAREVRASIGAGFEPGGWRFLTGERPAIDALAEAVGFRYTFNAETKIFSHVAALTFLGTDGKIIRYLNGLTILPFDLKMGVLDASEGRVRSFMDRVQEVCYGYDEAENRYVLRVNRIVLGVTLFLVAGFVLLLFFARPPRAKNENKGGVDGE